MRRIQIILTSILLCTAFPALAQQTAYGYSTVLQKSISFDTFTRIVKTSEGEFVAAGNSYHQNAFLSKFSIRGTEIWSYQYQVPYQFNQVFYKDLKFTDALPTSDGGVISCGSIVEENFNGGGGRKSTQAIILKTDRYGKLIWCRKLQSVYGGKLQVTNMIQTSDGDLIAYLATDNGISKFSYGRVLRLDKEGALKWNTRLYTNEFDAGPDPLNMKRSLLQTSHGDIIVGDAVFRMDRTDPDSLVKEAHVHFLSLDYSSGAIQWETDYGYVPPGKTFIVNQVKIVEQQGGRFLFITDLPVTGSNGVEKIIGCGISTDVTGHIEKINTYHSPGSVQTRISDVSVAPTGEVVFLFDHDGLPMLAGLNSAGGIAWKQGFSNEAGKFPASCFVRHSKGYALLSGDGRSWYSKLLLTNSHAVTCTTVPMELETGTAELHFGAYKVSVQTSPASEPFEFSSFTLNPVTYVRQQSVLCEELVNTCRDIIDSAHIENITICEGEQYTLPDQQKIRDSGRYYVRLPSSSGCDSIRFYQLSVEKHHEKLSLGWDTCLNESSPVTLIATPGYTSYTWMNAPGAPSNSKLIQTAGTYWVTITNSCGTKTDSVHVFDHCDFEIRMPTAFSPNGDGLNDVFRVPWFNRNRFISLRIYNRWGQLLFQATDRSKGWDGSFRSLLQPTGIFIYELEMQGLSGNRLRKRGSFVLLR